MMAVMREVCRQVGVRWGGAITIAAAAAGCAGREDAPLSVLVRDAATNEPVVAARVVADTPNADHPLSVSSMLGGTAAQQSIAFTDDDGFAAVKYVPGYAVRIGVLAPGYAMFIGLIESPWLGPTEVVSGEPNPGKPLRIRVQAER